MNGVNLVLDTNALIAVLDGHEGAINLIDNHDLYLSFIVELESQSYQKLSIEELKSVKRFLTDCVIIDLNPEIKQKTIFFRAKYNLKLADALIAATAFIWICRLSHRIKSLSELRKLH